MIDVETLARGAIACGFEGETMPDTLPAFGGYILFARNCADVVQVRALTDELRARGDRGVSQLIAIDQEGGRVVRLSGGVEAMPSMMALGAVGDLELAGRAGEQVAFDLRRAGCTLDFAPVLDLALDPKNTVIGTRSLGCDPGAVTALAQAFAAGLERGGILPCYKHFPGHGSTSVDSHEALPVIDVDEETLRRRDLAPFAAVAKNAPAIMGAHAIVRAFDAQRPATLSPRIVQELLRDEFGFDGAYLTDCLEMRAVAGADGSVASAVAALAAGADLLLVSHDVELAGSIAAAVERALADGTIARARLDQALARVLRLRAASAPPLPLDETPPHPGIGREIGRRAITLLRGASHADPTASFAISFEAEDSPKPSLHREAPALKTATLPLDPRPSQTDAVLNELAQSGRRPILLARRAHLHPDQARSIARVLDAYPDAVVVSMLEPFDVPLFPAARHVLAAYGDDPSGVGGLADVLFGGSLAEGRLPVRLGAGD